MRGPSAEDSWDALRVHHANHPRTRHIVDDVRTVIPLVATRGEPVDVLLLRGRAHAHRDCLEGATKRLQVRLIGNSVPPQLAEAVVRANLPRRDRRDAA